MNVLHCKPTPRHTSSTTIPTIHHRTFLLSSARQLMGVGLTPRLRAGHIVDIPSFPFVSSVYPNLSSAGAFDPQHLYTPADVAGIVQYAKARGVRVVPEFECGSTALRLTPRLSALG